MRVGVKRLPRPGMAQAAPEDLHRLPVSDQKAFVIVPECVKAGSLGCLGSHHDQLLDVGEPGSTDWTAGLIRKHKPFSSNGKLREMAGKRVDDDLGEWDCPIAGRCLRRP